MTTRSMDFGSHHRVPRCRGAARLLRLFGASILATTLANPVAADPNRRTLLIVAHQDDDVGIVADLVDRYNAGEPITTVYLTSGDAGEGCDEYVHGREQGVKALHAYMAGIPGAPACENAGESNCWADEPESILGKTVRTQVLRGTQVRLAFFGFTNPGATELTAWAYPTLERLWAVPGSTLTTLMLDGRTNADTYTKESLIQTLHALIDDFQPTDVQTLDPNRNQPSFFPFDHTDHIHAAHFALAALQRWSGTASVKFHRGYNIIVEPENLTPAEKDFRLFLTGIYEPFDAKICDTVTVTLCGVERDCFDPSLFDLLQGRRYSVNPLASVDRLVETRDGLCLDVLGDTVMAAGCWSFWPAQHWDVLADGRIRNRDRNQCIASPDGSSLVMASCQTTAPSQAFYLLSSGQLRGPDAQCVAANGNTLNVELCNIDSQQQGFRFR